MSIESNANNYLERMMVAKIANMINGREDDIDYVFEVVSDMDDKYGNFVADVLEGAPDIIINAIKGRFFNQFIREFPRYISFITRLGYEEDYNMDGLEECAKLFQTYEPIPYDQITMDNIGTEIDNVSKYIAFMEQMKLEDKVEKSKIDDMYSRGIILSFWNAVKDVDMEAVKVMEQCKETLQPFEEYIDRYIDTKYKGDQISKFLLKMQFARSSISMFGF